MMIVYYFPTLCLVSLFNGVFMGQSSWRPMLNRVQLRRFVPIYEPASVLRKSDSPSYGQDSNGIAGRIMHNELSGNIRFNNESSVSYNRANDGYGLGFNVLHNRDGGQGRGAMSVNSYVGSPEPQVDSVEPRQKNDIEGYFKNYQPITNEDHANTYKTQPQMRRKQSEKLVSNEGNSYNYDQNRPLIEEQEPKPINAFDRNRIQEVNHFFLSMAPKKYAIQQPQPVITNEFDQNKNPVKNNYEENKNPMVNNRHPFLHFYNANKNKFGDNHHRNFDSKTFPLIEIEKMNNEFHTQPNFDQNKNSIVTDSVRYPSLDDRRPDHQFEKALANHNDNYNYDQNKNPVPNVNGFHSTPAVVNFDQNRNQNHFDPNFNPVFQNKPPNEIKNLNQHLLNVEPPNNYLTSSFDGRTKNVHPIFENRPKQIQNQLYRLNNVVEKPLFYGDFDFKLQHLRY